MLWNATFIFNKSITLSVQRDNCLIIVKRLRWLIDSYLEHCGMPQMPHVFRLQMILFNKARCPDEVEPLCIFICKERAAHTKMSTSRWPDVTTFNIVIDAIIKIRTGTSVKQGTPNATKRRTVNNNFFDWVRDSRRPSLKKSISQTHFGQIPRK